LSTYKKEKTTFFKEQKMRLIRKKGESGDEKILNTYRAGKGKY
jgi:hypothetical protein